MSIKEELLSKLKAFEFDTSEKSSYSIGYSDCLTAVEDLIDDVISEDAENVIRCPHCSYCTSHTCAITGAKTLFCTYNEKPVIVGKAHFCGHGAAHKTIGARTEGRMK